MGMFDTIKAPCPKCQELNDFQTKAGACLMEVFGVADAPDDLMTDVVRKGPTVCAKCRTTFSIGIVKGRYLPVEGVQDKISDREIYAARMRQAVRSAMLLVARDYKEDETIRSFAEAISTLIYWKIFGMGDAYFRRALDDIEGKAHASQEKTKEILDELSREAQKGGEYGPPRKDG